MKNQKQHTAKTVTIATIGIILVAAILIIGTIWVGQAAKRDSEKAVHSVSLLYLDELAGRREQVVASNLKNKVDQINVALELMTEKDLSDDAHLQAYQAKMKKLYALEKFAFVDPEGLIYTSKGTQDNIGDYSIDYQNISKPEISVLNLHTREKKVIIAVPTNGIEFGGKALTVCFMEIDMDEMLQGVSMSSNEADVTFCNIYTNRGVAK